MELASCPATIATVDIRTVGCLYNICSLTQGYGFILQGMMVVDCLDNNSALDIYDLNLEGHIVPTLRPGHRGETKVVPELQSQKPLTSGQ